jgi:oligo-alginate lyase
MRNNTKPWAAGLVAIVTICAVSPPRQAAGEEWSVPEARLSADANHPVVACTAEELGRLRAAWKSTGAEHEAIVAAAIGYADAALKAPLEFPPRGGQHNQWYQCEKCQMGLQTVDDTHHKCPKCGTVYTGSPYDDVLFKRAHERNLGNSRAAAWAYAVTGERKYAEFTAKVLLGYAERYSRYEFHDSQCRVGDKAARAGARLYEQTLTEATALALEIAPAYDLIFDSGLLSPADRARIQAGLIEPMLQTISANHAGKSNWQTWHNAAMVWGGAILRDANWIRRAIADPENGFAFQMRASVSGDGMWYENTWAYHFYTLEAMVKIAEGARRCGIDLYSHPSFKKMFALPARYTMADGSLPRFGDDVDTRADEEPALMERAYAAYHDPAIAALLPQKPNWETVMCGRTARAAAATRPSGSEAFRFAGHAVLRTDGNAGLTAAMPFGPYGGGHGHFDKLSFVLFGCGQELGVDPGRAQSQAYRLPVHANWYKATIGHNAVIVDGQSQKPAEGKLESFGANASFAAAVAGCDKAYAGVKQRRMLCLTPEYAVVVDDLSSDKPHVYDWVYHGRGKGVNCDVADKDAAPDKDFQGMEYVADLKAGQTEKAVSVIFDGNDLDTRLTIAAGPATKVRTGNGVGATMLERVPLAMVERFGAACRFAAVLEPVRKGAKPAVSAVAARDDGGSIIVTVTCAGSADTITLAADGAVTVRRGEKDVLRTQH